MWRQFVTSLRLQLRNPTALAYNVAVPLLFFAAFWTLYRHESPPLRRHLGELLAVTALSGACFGLPALLVSERERGVWRRYRLAPVSTAAWLVAMLGSSYLLMLVAGALQVAAAIAAGAPSPSHPFDLWLAFTLTCVAFLGIGLLIAMLADSVPAAQALGQTLFLPMLIVGGIAVPLRTLPDWLQRVAACLPGTYAVQALQSAVTGRGPADGITYSLALLVMGVASALAAIAVFRWDAGQRLGFARTIAPAAATVAAWTVVGLTVTSMTIVRVEPVAPISNVPPAPAVETPIVPAAPALSAAEQRLPGERPRVPPSSVVNNPAPARVTPEPPVPASRVERTWRDVTMDDVNVNLVFVDLPPDHGVVTPINTAYRPYEDVECIKRALVAWPPAADPDVVQRLRNVLLLAAVPDLLQLEIERDVPLVLFDHLQQKIPKDDLIKVLYWIATHRSDGNLDALDHLASACLDVVPPDDADLVRERIGLYAMKLLGRITGKIK
jgi:ABC-2 type transport system permease protein